MGQGANATSPRLHTRTHSLLAAGPDCLLQGWAAREGEYLTSDAPHEGASPLPPGQGLLESPPRAMAARKISRCGVSAGPSIPHLPHPQDTGNRPEIPAQRTSSQEDKST